MFNFQSNNSQRGGGRGQWGEQFTGTTTIKDTWTKPRGRGEAGRGAQMGGWRDGEKMQTIVIE